MRTNIALLSLSLCLFHFTQTGSYSRVHQCPERPGLDGHSPPTIAADRNRIRKCFFVGGLDELTWRDATTFCAASSAEVALPGDERENRALAESIPPHVRNGVWLATRGLRELWNRWTGSDDSTGRLALVGCFRDSPYRPEFPVHVTALRRPTQSSCRSACLRRSYTYAALRFTESGRLECRCGMEFGRFGSSADCDTPCPSVNSSSRADPSVNSSRRADPSVNSSSRADTSVNGRCGGRLSQLVLLTSETGAFSSFARVPSSDDDHDDDHDHDHDHDDDGGGGGGFCVRMSPADHFLWTSQSCSHQYPFLCQYLNSSSCQLLNCSISFSSGFIDLYESPKSWFSAHTVCRQSGGYLASIDGVQQQRTVADYLQQIRVNQHVWIGISKWRWTTLAKESGFTAWASGHPAENFGATHLCGVTDQNATWRGEPCRGFHRVMCQRSISPKPKIETTLSTIGMLHITQVTATGLAKGNSRQDGNTLSRHEESTTRSAKESIGATSTIFTPGFPTTTLRSTSSSRLLLRNGDERPPFTSQVTTIGRETTHPMRKITTTQYSTTTIAPATPSGEKVGEAAKPTNQSTEHEANEEKETSNGAKHGEKNGNRLQTSKDHELNTESPARTKASTEQSTSWLIGVVISPLLTVISVLTFLGIFYFFLRNKLTKPAEVARETHTEANTQVPVRDEGSVNHDYQHLSTAASSYAARRSRASDNAGGEPIYVHILSE